MINVVIVEDNSTIRNGLASLIHGTDGYRCAGTYSNAETFIEDIKMKRPPDVVLMDIGLPRMSGIEATIALKKLFPKITILMLTIYEENDSIFDALKAGASGYLLKQTPPSKLLDAIKEAHEGGAPMTPQIARKVIYFFQQTKNDAKPAEDNNLTRRERDVLEQLVDGRNYKEIAELMSISLDTVRYHIKNIYRKLNVHSQSEAVAKAFRNKLT